MKAVLIFILLLATLPAEARNCSTLNLSDEVKETKLITTDVPSHLKGAKIIVRRADGQETEVPAELFKVVPRKQERIITKVETKTVETCREGMEHKNRVSILAGRGPKTGLNRSTEGLETEVKTRAGTVGGVQYQRLLNDRISVGGQVQSNQTGLLSLGLDF